ncbi:methionyl-tRNA formyltransferase [Clostridia bacterium]|nr:methionyl-tRNA formyltransferase [Clostridia bacterium]
MGTPQYAEAPLLALLEGGYEVSLVVTQPDQPRDRGKKLKSPPVKELAEKYSIPVLQPGKIRDNDEFYNRLKDEKADLFVVVAYGKILPPEILELPPLGCINIHGSLLPKFRGAAPIQRAIMEGEAETGVSLMYMDEGMDTGDVIGVSTTKILKKGAGAMFSELSDLGAELLISTLPHIVNGKVVRRVQDNSQATYAPMVSKEEGRLDFNRPADELERLIRGLDIWPGAYAFYGDGRMLKIWEGFSTDELCDEAPGVIVETSTGVIAVSAGGKRLLITKVQAPGKNIISSADFLRGSSLRPGDVLV